MSFLKKRKGRQKNLHPTETLSTSSSIFVFYPEGAVGHLCLALSASHFFLDFGEAVGFHPFFVSYFVLHNRFIDTRVFRDALRARRGYFFYRARPGLVW